MITLFSHKKILDEIQHSLMKTKSTQQTKNKGEISQLHKEHVQKPIVNIVFGGEKLDIFIL